MAYLEPDALVGVGTGSTVNHFIDLLAERARVSSIRGAVSSSNATSERLRAIGVPVFDLNEVEGLSLYVDGADEANDRLHLIKGGGAALTREKIVAAASAKFVCIVDESKCVDVLGKFPLPVEVIPMARAQVARELATFGGTAQWREGITTDNGNHILDIHGLKITDPVALENAINGITGVVCVGLFARRPADVLIVGGSSGTRVLTAR